MTELERYQPPTEPSHVDSWVNVLGQVGDLAQKIAGTDFVPDGMRGKPAAVAAAILTGREMGVPPMKSLAHVFIVKGKPGLSAELMRSLILAAGHEFRFVETTNTRCIMEGRRRGSEEWERVSFTADQARAAKIDLGGYPEDKLVARATSRLARRVFPDVLGGVSYLPGEAAEQDAPAPASAPATTTAVPVQTARRTVRGPSRPPAPVAPEKPAQPAAPLVHDEPPLDDIEDAVIVEDTPAPAEAVANAAQLRAMGAAFTNIGWTDRADRLRATSAIIHREVKSAKELTKTEAGLLLDTLAWVQEQTDPSEALTALLAATDEPALDDDAPKFPWPEGPR